MMLGKPNEGSINEKGFTDKNDHFLHPDSYCNLNSLHFFLIKEFRKVAGENDFSMLQTQQPPERYFSVRSPYFHRLNGFC